MSQPTETTDSVKNYKKAKFINPEIQKYVDEHTLKLTKFQKQIHDFSMKQGSF